jgi:hypothetical protein
VRTNTLPVLALLLILATPVAAEPDASFAMVQVLGERPSSGRIVALGPEGVGLQPTTGERRTWPLDVVREIRFAAPETPEGKPPPHRVTLIGGEVLVGQVSEPTDNGFKLSVVGIGPIEVSFEVLRSLEVLDGQPDPCEDLADTYGPIKGLDVAHVKGSGDRYTGMLLGANEERLVIENERQKPREIPWSDLLVLHLENEPPPPVTGVAVEIELAEGTRIFCAKPPVLDAGSLRFAMRSAPDRSQRVPLSYVQAIRFSGGRFEYASDLPFDSTLESYYEVPEDMAFGPDLEGRRRFFGPRKDRRPSGCPLVLAGTTFRHGFAMHSKSSVRIPIGGRYVSFEAAFGIDDEVKRSDTKSAAANVDARVLADGKVVWEKKGVTLADSPVKVGPVDITGTEVLELVVDFGQNNWVGDDATWANPILVKK